MKQIKNQIFSAQFTVALILICTSLFAKSDLKYEIEKQMSFSEERETTSLLSSSIKESMLTVSSFNYQCESGEGTL